MAVPGPGALCRGHQEAGAGLCQALKQPLWNSRAVPAPGLDFGNSFHRRHQVPSKPELGLTADTAHHMWLQGLAGRHEGCETLCSSSLPGHFQPLPSSATQGRALLAGMSSPGARGVPKSLPVLLDLVLPASAGQAHGEAGGWRWRGRDGLRVSGEGDRGHGWVTGATRATPDTAGHCQHPSAPSHP